MLPALTLLADFLGILGGLVIAVFDLKIGASFYITTTLQSLQVNDFLHGLCKTPFFGFEIALIGCYNGLSATGGADGVGRATTTAVVLSSIAVLVTDFFLTKLFIALPLGISLSGETDHLVPRRLQVLRRQGRPRPYRPRRLSGRGPRHPRRLGLGEIGVAPAHERSRPSRVRNGRPGGGRHLAAHRGGADSGTPQGGDAFPGGRSLRLDDRPGKPRVPALGAHVHDRRGDRGSARSRSFVRRPRSRGPASPSRLALGRHEEAGLPLTDHLAQAGRPALRRADDRARSGDLDDDQPAHRRPQHAARDDLGRRDPRHHFRPFRGGSDRLPDGRALRLRGTDRRGGFLDRPATLRAFFEAGETRQRESRQPYEVPGRDHRLRDAHPLRRRHRRHRRQDRVLHRAHVLLRPLPELARPRGGEPGPPGRRDGREPSWRSTSPGSRART